MIAENTNQITPFEWEDYTRNTKYPFLETCTLYSNEKIYLPEDWILDASITGIFQGVAYLKQISKQKGNLILTIGDSQSTYELHGTITIDNINQDVIDLYGPTNKILGAIKINPLSTTVLQYLNPQTLTFTPGATTFAAKCVLPTTNTLVNFLSINKQLIDGDLILTGLNGIYFEVQSNEITIHADGDPLSGDEINTDIPLKQLHIINTQEPENDYYLTPDNIHKGVIITNKPSYNETPIKVPALRVFKEGKAITIQIMSNSARYEQ